MFRLEFIKNYGISDILSILLFLNTFYTILKSRNNKNRDKK